MIKYYDITESQMESKAIEDEAVYFCSDTGNIYFDSITNGGRTKMSNTIIILTTETERNNLLAPIPNKLYCVLQTGCLYIYNNGSWIQFGGLEKFQFNNVVVEDGTLTITDSRISTLCTATFVPDLSVADLASDITVTCAAGSLTVKLTSDYPIPGTVYVN